jgi:hypothetical protein
MGKDSYILIHDNLDANIVWFKILAESGQLFAPSDALIPNLFNGVPRISFASEFNIYTWLYFFFKPYTAYVVNLCLMHVFAFGGMYYLLGRHFLKISGPQDELIRTGVALAFSLLPFWPSGGLSIAGLPMALCIFLNIRNADSSLYDWFFLLLLPLYSSLILSFWFFLLAMLFLWGWDLLSRRCSWLFLGAIVLMGAEFLAIEYRLVLGMFFNQGFTSHRNEFVATTYNAQRAIWVSFRNFIKGHYHFHSLHYIIILPVACVSLFVSIIKKEKDYLIFGLILLIAAISLWYGFWTWEGWSPLKEQVFLLRSFTFFRAISWHPLLWYLLFAVSLQTIGRRIKYAKFSILLLLLLQTGWLFANSDFIKEYYGARISYKEFYAEDQFEEIEKYINKPQDEYRVVSLGIHPAIAAYNGFYTADMYVGNYPIEYKYKFRKVIASELEKDEKLMSYYDNWGCRVYLFSHELGMRFLYSKKLNKVVSDLNIDSSALLDLGVEYLISAVRIENYLETNLEFSRIFRSKTSAWNIYLYRVVGG